MAGIRVALDVPDALVRVAKRLTDAQNDRRARIGILSTLTTAEFVQAHLIEWLTTEGGRQQDAEVAATAAKYAAASDADKAAVDAILAKGGS